MGGIIIASMPIRLLAPEVASQIAAGEVIERPASVVKELLENALDAGARQITVRVEGAGQRLVEVADDGCGIPADELLLAVERHATSKLQSADDLFSIETLGFRGEALASIGSVSRMTIVSRSQAAAVAGRILVEGGHSGALEPAGAPVGTLIRVENLFYNVPARLKFLKTDVTERRQIDGLVMRYALAYPHVRFQLYQEGHPALQTSGNGQRREVLASLYGVEAARQMLEVLAREDEIGVSGFTSPLSMTRSHRRDIHFFVNGRPVADPALSAALIQAYHTLLMVGRYPVALLFLELPPQAVDVNVHPTKAEVRFRETDKVFSAVQRSLRRALMAHTPIPELAAQVQFGAPLRWQPDPGGAQPPLAGSAAAFPSADHDQSSLPVDEQAWEAQALQAGAPQTAPGLPGVTPLLRLVGQIASTYLVAEGPDGLYLIDQHAAHERVLFEKLMLQRQSGIPSQGLLHPAPVDLPPASARLVGDKLEMLARLGFEIEPFGPSTYLVRSIPQVLAGMDPGAALRVLVEDFEEDETPLQAEIEAQIVARVCKRAAVKAGHTLTPLEQSALLDDLQACRSPRTCPHGRPTMIHPSLDLLERQFGRKGAR